MMFLSRRQHADTDSSDDDVAEAEPLRVLVVDDDVLTCKVTDSERKELGIRDFFISRNGEDQSLGDNVPQALFEGRVLCSLACSPTCAEPPTKK